MLARSIAVYLTLLTVVSSTFCLAGGENTVSRILLALDRGLQFMRREIREANVDAIFCIRQVAEQLEVYLKYEPEIFEGIAPQLEKLCDEAHQTVEEGRRLLTIGTRSVYVAKVGFAMNRSKKLLWYPTLNTSTPKAPLPCNQSTVDPYILDHCFGEIGQLGSSSFNPCNISLECARYMTKSNRSGYYLTHEALYFQLLEEFQCIEKVTIPVRVDFCSDVFRDASKIAHNGYLSTFMDLFFEQIGICGMWGFKDFNKPEWLEKILEMQDPSGCYSIKPPKSFNICVTDEIGTNNHFRVKRDEKGLESGCYFHVTGVALMALAVNLRFEMEKLNKKT